MNYNNNKSKILIVIYTTETGNIKTSRKLLKNSPNNFTNKVEIIKMKKRNEILFEGKKPLT